MPTRALLIAALALATSSPVSAQFVNPDIVDRLVAVVGDSSIVQTQVMEEIQRMRLGGAPVPEESDPAYEELFRDVLERFVERLLILQAASRDSLLQVDEAVIEEGVNEQIAQLTREFGGQPALQQALAAEGLTLAEYRETLKHDQRINRIQQLFFESRLRDAPPMNVTEDELVARFQEARSQLQQRPRLLTMRQVVVSPEPSEASIAAARAKADSLYDRVLAGEDFAEIARAESDDPGSAPLGGDLGWFRRGRMLREFEEPAFAIAEGVVDHVVETEYGFHIIKVERARRGERQARHILVQPETSEAEVEEARTTAREVLSRAQAGTSMVELFEEFSDPAAPDSMTFAFEQLADLPPAYAALRTASPGDFLGPLEYEIQAGELRVAVVQVVEIREAGAYTLDDVRARLADQLQQEKQIERILERLRATTYIDIRME